ncbi:MAG: EAL domain-containing protein [Oceanospirillales bacterium]|nr:EAL domain-containing protein [Oceanospirillales bacterium]
MALISWSMFWFYTHITVDTTERAVSGQLKEWVLYRFDTAVNNINTRADQLERRANALLDQPASGTGSIDINTLKAPLEHTLKWSQDLAGATVYDWPVKQASLALYLDGQSPRVMTQTALPLWLQQLPDTLTTRPDAKSVWWSPAHRHPVTGDTVVTLVKPILSTNGQLSGLISLDWKLDAILALATEAEATAGTLIWLTDRSGRQLAPEYLDQRRSYAKSLMLAAQQQTPMTIFQTGFEQLTLDKPTHPADLYYAPVNNGMSLAVAIPHTELEAPLQALRERSKSYLIYLGAAIMLLTVLGLSRLVPALRSLRASYIDKLTGLPNRSRLLQNLERDKSVSLILINLDRFREVNGLFGDHCGDLILKEVALRLESFMSSDENKGGELYHIQGDEFAITLPRRRPEMVQAQLEQILGFIRQTPIHWQNHEIGLSATVSAAVPWFDAPREHSLYIHAREAMREAREKGLHCCVYDGSEPLEQEFEYNQKWAGKLRDALDTEGLVAWFQPILNNTTGHIDKYECLVRMMDNDGGVISPGKFLGVAGKLRLEGHITRVMVEQCFVRFTDSPMQFSINLSYTDLQQAELTQFILQRLDETGVGSRVIFELLESANIENYDQVRTFVDEVKKRGCRIAIDDFGTGYSNFEHLLQLQVDIIKIDGSLIRNLDKDPNARRVVRGIVGLARSMKMETVAEYVHCEAIQMEVLRLGINFSQGELISMPAPELIAQVPKELTKLSYSGRSRAKTALNC